MDSTLKKNLFEKLEQFSKSPCALYCKRLLEAIYDCSFVKCCFEPGEKQKIGTYLKYSLQDLLLYLHDFGLKFDPTNGNNISPLMVRSAFAFIVEDYAQFPTDKKDETLKDILDEIEDESDGDDETILELENAIKRWIECILYYNDVTYGYTEDDLVRPKEIPESHIWWLKDDTPPNKSFFN